VCCSAVAVSCGCEVWCVATASSGVLCVAACYRVLQCVAVCWWDVVWCVALRSVASHVLQRVVESVAECCIVSQRCVVRCAASFGVTRVAVCCSVLQRVAVCCSVQSEVHSCICIPVCAWIFPKSPVYSSSSNRAFLVWGPRFTQSQICI